MKLFKTAQMFAVGLMVTVWLLALAAYGETTGSEHRSPVVVELFTSQGCNSCPPADAYLQELAQRDGIVALEYHVDYWDYIGWEDPFADPGFTLRQRRYAANLEQRYVYTPQMVVDGVRHEIGSQRPAVEMAIKLAYQDKLEFAPRVTLNHKESGLSVLIEGQEAPRPFEVVLVSFDAEHVTRVRRGENAGRTMTNAQVVRSLDKIGLWRGGVLELAIAEGLLAGTGGCAVLIQEVGGGRILAAAQLPFDS